MKNIALIGSTGSIGKQVLNVVRAHPDMFRITALVANSPSAEFERQKEEFGPRLSALASKDKNAALAAAEADCSDIVFNAAGGFSGFEYTLRAVRAGKDVALANKESLVCGGELVMAEAERRGVTVIPVDSEHSAIWQCLGYDRSRKARRLIITASGGAFRGRAFETLENVTAEQALAHPTWKMGKKITVDSATLMNKGYEIIEAHVLYNVPYGNIEAVIQPQSIVHSMVEFDDGAILAQMSYPTMELPIQLALTYPQRHSCNLGFMDFTKAFSVDFEPLEREKYPLFGLALRCGESGGTMPCALNAADEVAVWAFLNKKIKYTDIYTVAEGVVSSVSAEKVDSFEQLCEVDANARRLAERFIKNMI